MCPEACPQYTVESTAWQLTPKARESELPDPFVSRRRSGAVPSSTARALLQRVCEQDGEPEPTERSKRRVQLPCPEPAWSVNGMDAPHATVGATHTPK